MQASAKEGHQSKLTSILQTILATILAAFAVIPTFYPYVSICTWLSPLHPVIGHSIGTSLSCILGFGYPNLVFHLMRLYVLELPGKPTQLLNLSSVQLKTVLLSFVAIGNLAFALPEQQSLISFSSMGLWCLLAAILLPLDNWGRAADWVLQSWLVFALQSILSASVDGKLASGEIEWPLKCY